MTKHYLHKRIEFHCITQLPVLNVLMATRKFTATHTVTSSTRRRLSSTPLANNQLRVE